MRLIHSSLSCLRIASFRWKRCTWTSLTLDQCPNRFIFGRSGSLWELKSSCGSYTREVILTKDNFAKCNWAESTKCCFCDQPETIKHLFLDCPFAKILWRSIHIAFNITPPPSICTLFGNWLGGVDIVLAKNMHRSLCATLGYLEWKKWYGL